MDNVVIKYVNETRPEDVVVALSEYEATDICWRECNWWSEDIKKCFNCTCPLALADKEAAKRLEQIAHHIRCQQWAIKANSVIHTTLNAW